MKKPVDTGKNKRRTKQQRILQDIRRQIIAGELPAGCRLPTYEDYEKRYKVSRMTMQQAFNQLKLDGYVEAVERQGMFVAQKTPHLNRIGLLITSHERNSRFWRLILSEAQAYTEEMGYEIETFRQLGDFYKSTAEWERLASEIEAERLAGAIFTFTPTDCSDVSLFDDASFPKICTSELPASFAIHLNNKQFAEKALNFFQERGRKKIAFFTSWRTPPIMYYILDGIKERNMITKESWQICIRNFEIADNLVQLLMSLEPEKRPDALFIADDHMTEPACAGLMKSGVKVGEDIDVVGHFNWCMDSPPPMPIQYLGFDVREYVVKSIETIRDFRMGKPVPAEQTIHPLFKDEYLAGKRSGR